MKDWLGLEGPIASMLNKMGSMIGVSLLWLICSLPIVTIGSATTALYYTTVKVLRADQGYIFKEYLHSFKENLKNGTIITTIVLALAIILYLDISYVSSTSNQMGLLMPIYYIIIILMVSILIYIFPNLSRFKMGKKELLKLSFYMAFRHLPITVLLIILLIATALLIWLIPIPCILFMPGTLCYFNSYLMEWILIKYMAKPTKDSEEAKKWYYKLN